MFNSNSSSQGVNKRSPHSSDNAKDMVHATYTNIDSTLHDRTHKGNRQAGNKSLLSFRADVGIPGYTGFIPIVNCVRVPGKNAEHTGKFASSELVNEALKDTLRNPRNESLYKETFTPKKPSGRPGNVAEGGYWIKTHRQIDPSYPLKGATTYQTEIENSEPHAKEMISRTDGLTMTLSNYEAARLRSMSARATGTMPKDGRLADPMTRTWHRDLKGPGANPSATVGYTTEYSSMVLADPKTGGTAAAGRPSTVPAHAAPPLEPRAKVAPRGLRPQMAGTSSYHVSYGALGDDPALRWGPASKKFIAPTTVELDTGTVRASDHIPGYSGFVPASGTGPMDARPNYKDNMLLLDLNQYSRQILPGYCGAKPREAVNVRLDMKATTQTVYGKENHATQALARTMKIDPITKVNATGVLSFFTGGGEFVSDNGKNEAEKFYSITGRPNGALPSVAHPSKTTVYGRKFTA